MFSSILSLLAISASSRFYGSRAITPLNLSWLELLFTLTRSSIRLAQGLSFETMNTLIRLGHAKVARAPVPRQGLGRIAGNAVYTGKAQHYRVEALRQPQCSLPIACVGSTLIVKACRGNVAGAAEHITARGQRGNFGSGKAGPGG